MSHSTPFKAPMTHPPLLFSTLNVPHWYSSVQCPVSSVQCPVCAVCVLCAAGGMLGAGYCVCCVCVCCALRVVCFGPEPPGRPNIPSESRANEAGAPPAAADAFWRVLTIFAGLPAAALDCLCDLFA